MAPITSPRLIRRGAGGPSPPENLPALALALPADAAAGRPHPSSGGHAGNGVVWGKDVAPPTHHSESPVSAVLVCRAQCLFVDSRSIGWLISPGTQSQDTSSYKTTRAVC